MFFVVCVYIMANKLTTMEMAHVNRVGRMKVVKTFIKVYNSLCAKCRAKVFRMSKEQRGNVDNYCEKCQSEIKKLLRN